MKKIPFSELYKSEFFPKNIRTDLQFWQNNSSWSTPKDGRINTAIMMPLARNAVYGFSDGSMLYATCGDIVLMPQGAVYTCTFYPCEDNAIDLKFQGVPRSCLFLGFNLYDGDFNEFTFSDSPSVIFRGSGHDFLRSFEKLCKLRHRPECTPGLFAGDTSIFLSSLSSKYSSMIRDKSSDDTLSKLQSYIHGNIDSVSTALLHEMCDVSPSTLRRKFARRFGMTPTAYINSVKIEKAKTLLESGITKIRDVSHLCGIEDEFYFSRLFTKTVGISPTAYLKMMNDKNK